METLETIKGVIEEVVERKPADIVPVGLSFPLRLADSLSFGAKKVNILLEIYESVVVAYLADDRDFFAEGVTVRQAKSSLRASLRDEHMFFMRHRADLSQELAGKLSRLQVMLG